MFLTSLPILKKPIPNKRLLLYISVFEDVVEAALVQDDDG